MSVAGELTHLSETESSVLSTGRGKSCARKEKGDRQSAWHHFQAMKKENSVPHALLISGDKKEDKIEFAKALAASLLCESPHADGFACGKCKQCQWFNAENHPDFFAIMPEAEGQMIKIEAIRELKALAYQTPQVASAKIFMIDPADALNKAAANALLKMLEEPSPHTYFLLMTVSPSLLSATIYSRCQRMVLVNSEAEPQEEMNLKKSIITALLHFIQTRKGIIKLAAELDKMGIDNVLTSMEIVANDLIRLKINQDIIRVDFRAKFVQTMSNISLVYLYRILDKIYYLRKLRYQKINMNSLLLLEYLLIYWWEGSC